MGKGSKPRPQSVSREELDLRWKYATHQISLAEFEIDYEELRQKGLLRRSGRVLK